MPLLSQIPFGKAVSIEVECLGPHPAPSVDYTAKRDGSLSYGGVEVVFTAEHPADGPVTFPSLDVLRNHKVDRSCGLHVHIDVRDLSTTEAQRVYERLQKCSAALKLLVPDSRLHNRYCMWRANAGRGSRYAAINFQSYYKFKTIEFRCQSGSTERTKIEMWSELCYQLVQWARNNERSSQMSWKGFLSILSPAVREWAVRRRVKLRWSSLMPDLEAFLAGRLVSAKASLDTLTNEMGVGMLGVDQPLVTDTPTRVRAPRSSNRILGYSVSSVLRRMGQLGYTETQANVLLDHFGAEVQASTVRFMLRTGATQPTGSVAPLEMAQFDQMFREASEAIAF